MSLLKIQVEEEKRADVFVSEAADLSRAMAVKLIENGAVTYEDGKTVKKSEKVKQNQLILVDIPEPAEMEVKPEDIPLDVRYEDGDVIVVNKPKGMVVHPAPGHPDGTLVNALLFHCGDSLSGIGGVMRPGIVHRIDKDTSGLLIVAKNDMAHQKLSDDLQVHAVSRTYYAIVTGHFKESEFTVNEPIGRSLKDRKKMAVVSDGRTAITHVKVLEEFTGYSLVECKLETGRTHQIRVHLSYMHHPIIGDTVYGSKNDPFHLNGQCLHAKELEFIHPRTGEKITVSSDLPEYFINVLEKLKKAN